MEAPITLDTVRNIGIVAHIDAGKTTLSERFLYYSGKTHRIGEVDSGNTVMDYLDEERRRGITIVAAAASFKWNWEGKSGMVHLIDTPGHIDFTAEVERSLRVCDGAVVVFSGVEGVEAQSEKVWRQSEHYHLPKIAFINKLDRAGASFYHTVAEMREKFPAVKIVPLQIPTGTENDFNGVIDLIDMNLLRFSGEDGAVVRPEPIPEEFRTDAETARESMVAALADFSDAIAERYLAGEAIYPSELRQELRLSVIANQICPVFAGSAKKNIGVQPVLDAVIAYLPSPRERSTCYGINPKHGTTEKIDPSGENFCGLVFKVVAGDSADLLYLRSYSGKLNANDTLLNTRTGEKVRVKRLLRLYSKNVEAIEQIEAGDIIGVIGPVNTGTGDTLCAVNHPIALESISFPEPVLSIAIEPKSSKDKERLQTCLTLLCREDPTLKLKHHDNTGQLILSGMGELHLEINTNRIQREFHLEARFGKPRVAFRETLKNPIRTTGVFNKLIGETLMHTEVELSLAPMPEENLFCIKEEIRDKSGIPHAWSRVALETLGYALKTGGNLGYTLIQISAVLHNIRGNPENTSEGSIAGAVLDAVQQAIARGTVLLEPLMKLDIIAPDTTIGEINSYLQMRRALILGIDEVSGARHLHCRVPLAEMFGFSTALPKLSGGRGSFSMEPCGYQILSDEDLRRLVNDDKVCY